MSVLFYETKWQPFTKKEKKKKRNFINIDVIDKYL